MGSKTILMARPTDTPTPNAINSLLGLTRQARFTTCTNVFSSNSTRGRKACATLSRCPLHKMASDQQIGDEQRVDELGAKITEQPCAAHAIQIGKNSR